MNKSGKKNSNYRHGHNTKNYTSLTYTSWSTMKNRCKSTDITHKSYKNIFVCKDWYKFKNFLKDMGERPMNKTLDRIDNSKGYCKKNCRWATKSQQQRNTSRATLLNYKGETKHIEEWAKILSTTTMVIRARIRRGWTIDRIINTKVGKYRDRI